MRKTRSDKGGHHNYPKRNKNVAADIKISNKQQLLNLVNKNIEFLMARREARKPSLENDSEAIREIKQGQYANELNEKGTTLHTLTELKASLEKRRMVTKNALELYTEMIFEPKEHYSREEKGGRLILNMLSKQGVDVGDTTKIKAMLGGYSPIEIYEGWLAMNYDDRDWYDVLEEDAIANIKDIVEYLNKVKTTSLEDFLNEFGNTQQTN